MLGKMSVWANRTATETYDSLTIAELVEYVRHDKELHKKVHAIRSGDQAVKNTLPAVTPSATLAGRSPSKHQWTHSGVVCLDYDHVTEPEMLRAMLANYPHAAAAFVSPSGTGVKAFVLIAPHPTTIHQHKQAWQQVVDHITDFNPALSDVDPATKDLARLCYMSHDPMAWFNELATPLEVTLTDTQPPAAPAPIDVNDTDIIAALTQTPNNDPDTRMRVGMALRNHYKEAKKGLTLYLRWMCHNVDEPKVEHYESRYLSFDPDGDVTIRSLFHLAREYDVEAVVLDADIELKPPMALDSGLVAPSPEQEEEAAADEGSQNGGEVTDSAASPPSIDLGQIPKPGDGVDYPAAQLLKLCDVDFLYDVRSGRVLFKPLRPYGSAFVDQWQPFADRYLDQVCAALWRCAIKSGEKRPSKLDIKTAISDWATGKEQDTFVTKYLDKLPEWDGVERCAPAFGWLFEVSEGYEDLAPHIIPHILGTALLRAYEPGAIMDETAVIVGEGRQAKSLFVKNLLPKNRSSWFVRVTDLSQAGSVKMLERVRSAVIVDLGELSGLSKADTAKLKGFMTDTEQQERFAYGYFAEEILRRFAMVGTANYLHDTFADDNALVRRFLPIRIERSSPHVNILDWLNEHRDLLWAEMLHRHKTEAPYRGLPDGIRERYSDIPKEQRRIPEGARMVDLMSDEEIHDKRPQDLYEAMGEGSPDWRTKNEIASALRRRGFLKVRKQIGGGRHYVYVKDGVIAEGEPIELDVDF